MKILSLDASTKASGYAFFDNEKLKKYGCITAASTDLIKRINKIVIELKEILTEEKVDIIIMEEVRPEQGKVLQTYRALMWLQAAINFLIHDFFPNIKIEYIYPSSWRKICGIPQGSGIKRNILKAKDIEFVNKIFNINTTSDDIADAIAIGYAYINNNNDANKKEINWE